MINSITVVFDGRCEFCRRCAKWLAAEPSYFKVKPISSLSDEAQTTYASLRALYGKDPVVIDNLGGVYCGTNAWIMCLYALIRYRAWSLTLARPLFKPFAKSFFTKVSSSRHFISRFLASSPNCANGVCQK